MSEEEKGGDEENVNRREQENGPLVFYIQPLSHIFSRFHQTNGPHKQLV